MTKAFTEEEKIEIKEKIMETALELFHDGGTKSLSIQELTNRVGIAQGSFYNFWKDKDSLIIDLLAYRSIQKLSILEKEFNSSLENPIKFLTDIIYTYSMDLVIKSQTQRLYKDAFKIFSKRSQSEVNQIKKLYEDFLDKLFDYWLENKAVYKINSQGIYNLFIGSFILCHNSHHFDDYYFKETLKIYIHSILNEYISVE